MAYKTKAEKKAFRAGMTCQKKRDTIWEACLNRGGKLVDILFKAPNEKEARKKFNSYYNRHYKKRDDVRFEGLRKHPVNYD